ncbi:MAG: hypothetical protein HON98_12125 [Chloroflexi bacterium]|jgi:hypothetical protein|nr:hypothetical protein [Chloroflexota bacterium]MBT3668606.1 hypothetical protein [Chloroflexota bacterium]MBT4003184.1 hypothetical protein [Chloroflexota bacterium]MBT4306479.1 hypothetical protein [Chloroflexota bacterium]MBT4534979.1 hypothetical protein [Chloroflexota bacterium]
MSILEKIKLKSNNPLVVWIALLILSTFSYGIYVGWMGFYWDDWPWIYFGKAFGSDFLLSIDQQHRPLSGVLFSLGHVLFGENPLGWQISNFLARWLSAASLWWALTKLWPKQKERVLSIAFVFLIYPGYNHQFISVNSLRHVLPYSFFFFSIGTMILAARDEVNRKAYIFATLVLALISMLTTEYFYGLEFIRPFILYIVIRQNERPFSLKKLLKRYLPYFLMLLSVFIWRYLVSKSVNYSISITRGFFDNPGQAILEIITSIFDGFWIILVRAPGNLLEFYTTNSFGSKAFLYSILIGIVGFIFCSFFFAIYPKDEIKKTWGFQSFLLGIFSLAVGGISFIVTSLNFGINFPADRALLPLSFGASLVFVGFFDWIIKRRTIKIAIFSLFIGLSLINNFKIAQSYSVDWLRQSDFFNQLIWRVPGLERNTIIYSIEFPIPYTHDNSLNGPLNLIYDQTPIDQTYGYFLVYMDLRNLGNIEFDLEPQSYSKNNHNVPFTSLTNESIALTYNGKDCLRVIHPEYDKFLPNLNSQIFNILPHSNLEQISLDPSLAGVFPSEIYTQSSTDTWCYYFQKADLARQFEDWELLVEYGDQAQSAGLSPENLSEYIPFIQGYALHGDFDTAYSLSEKTLEDNPKMINILCPIWADISIQSNLSDGNIQKLDKLLDC